MENLAQDIKKFKPLFSRKVFFIMSLTALISGILTGGIGGWLNIRTLKKARISRGEELLYYLAQSSETAVVSKDDTFLEGTFDRLSSSKFFSGVAVYDNSGKLLFSRLSPETPQMAVEIDNRINLREEQIKKLSETKNTITFITPVYVTRYNTSQITHGSTDKIATKQVLAGFATFRINSSLTRSEKQQTVITGFILFATVFGIGLFFSWGAARALSNPIRRIIKGVNSLSQGSLDTRIPVTSRDEMGQISDLINILATNLEQRMDELEKWSKVLEDKVAKRTQEVKLTKEFLHDLISPISGMENSWKSILEILLVGSKAEASALFINMDEKFQVLSTTGYSSKIPEPVQNLKNRSHSDFEGRSTINIPLDSPSGIAGQLILSGKQDMSIEFIEQILPALTITISNIQTFDKLNSVTSALEERTKILEKQREELIRQKEQIETAIKLKSEFLANVSHELRIPLNAIIGYSEMLAAGYYGDINPDQMDSMQAIEESGRNLLNLINTILDHSRMEAGKLPLYVEMVEDIRKLVKDAVNRNQSLTRERDYKVELSLPDTPVPCMTDGGKIQQIVTNLISNAVKFTSEGFVKVDVVTSHSSISISVSDSGTGIAPEDQEKIFEEFRQLDGSSTRSAGGTGLGLSVSRKMAHLIRGEISVKSEEGKGSTFTLTFPRRIEKES
ncbi:MAG: HAMP domain-containing protein [Deltaproteobacteria bacterium]|nr:HAMP domain-containing protein [Deltaproteobacteria bacterium]